MVNRGAVILRYKDPFVKWIKEADPVKDSSEVSLASANEERTVYLITDGDAENIDRWILENHGVLFESEFEGWYTDESLWPKKRDLKTFKEWFEVECHSVVLDTVGGQIFDDEI
jgi:hypothetical protein